MKLKDILATILSGRQIPSEELSKMTKEEMEDLNKALELLNKKLHKNFDSKPINISSGISTPQNEMVKYFDNGQWNIEGMEKDRYPKRKDLEYPSEGSPGYIGRIKSMLMGRQEDEKRKIDAEAQKKKDAVDFNAERRKDFRTRKLIDENKDKPAINRLAASEDSKKEGTPELDYKDTAGYADAHKQKELIRPASHFDINEWDKIEPANRLAASEDDKEVCKCGENGQWAIEKSKYIRYSIPDNIKRKENNIEDAGDTGHQSMPRQKKWGGSGVDAATEEAKKLHQKSKAQPVKIYTPEEIAEYEKNKK
jgi:hypothetical protein